MDWKDWFERNAFFVVVGACIATGGTVAGVMEYYSAQREAIATGKCESQVNDLKTQLASITRSIGHEEFLDVTTIVVPRARISPVPNSQYFDDAEFYAPPATGDWIYAKSSEAALAQSMVEADVNKIEIVKAVGNLVPIHLWRMKKTLSVKGGPGFTSLFAYVYVERLPVDQLKTALGTMLGKEEPSPTGGKAEPSAPAAGKSSGNPEPSAPAAGKSAVLDSMFRGDIAGKLLTATLVAQLQLEDVMPVELLNVQKIHNVVYLAFRYNLKDVEVEKTAYHHYYIYSEEVIISDGPNATIVKTFVPSADPSGNLESSRYISGWLGGLRVLVG